MVRNQDALKAALRVLAVITGKETPDDADLQELSKLAPEFAHLPPDQRACAVIQQELKERKQSESAASIAAGESDVA
jgi:hypothetical protein